MGNYCPFRLCRERTMQKRPVLSSVYDFFLWGATNKMNPSGEPEGFTLNLIYVLLKKMYAPCIMEVCIVNKMVERCCMGTWEKKATNRGPATEH
jgi:hypothetical protein